MSITMEWAKNEMEMACKRERADSGTPKDEWDYGCACYESAFEAFKVLYGQGHSGLSMSTVKQILINLMNGKPLTPIEGKDEEWTLVSGRDDFYDIYQNMRLWSLFKYVYPDGSIAYSDHERYVEINTVNGARVQSDLGERFINKAYPIRMPYCDFNNPYKIYEHRYCFYGVELVEFGCVLRPDKKLDKIDRYFKLGLTDPDWIEITQDDFYNILCDNMGNENIENEEN